MKAVNEHNYTTPTKIQETVIPFIIEGKDIMASAETGAGKTVAFILPTLQRLLMPAPQIIDSAPENTQQNTQSKHSVHTQGGRGPRALILTPTRELADQVTKVIVKMAKYTSLKIGSITGGVPYFAQENLLRKPLDILVATPGRLLDHMEKGRVDYSRVELFILDEADRMLDMGFMKDIEVILNELPEERQILLFSATLEGDVYRIANRFLKDPERIQLTSREKSNALITQKVHQVNNMHHKRAVLSHILEDASVWQAIVFTATKREASELADNLSAQDISCAELHGDMKQSKRTRTIELLRQGKVRVLVATDVAARGLDVKNLSHVINYDMPKSGEDYIHRIGRTGRAGETGTAISLVSPRDGRLLAQIERFIGRRLEREKISNFQYDPNTNAMNDDREMNNRHRRFGDDQRNDHRNTQRTGDRERSNSSDRNFSKNSRFSANRSHGSVRSFNDRKNNEGRFSDKRSNNVASDERRHSDRNNDSSGHDRKYRGRNDNPIRKDKDFQSTERRYNDKNNNFSRNEKGSGDRNNNVRFQKEEQPRFGKRNYRSDFNNQRNDERSHSDLRKQTGPKRNYSDFKEQGKNDRKHFESNKVNSNSSRFQKGQNKFKNKDEFKKGDDFKKNTNQDYEKDSGNKPGRKKTIDKHYLEKKTFENNPNAKNTFLKKPFKKKPKDDAQNFSDEKSKKRILSRKKSEKFEEVI